jgi:hypothetical protein
VKWKHWPDSPLDRVVAYKITTRHARLWPSGQPMRCVPSLRELRTRERKETAGSDGKVIYDDVRAAGAAAAELRVAGAQQQYPYRCGRSMRGHYHLTTHPK